MSETFIMFYPRRDRLNYIQQHEVEPAIGYGVRFVNTCRVILPEHLPRDQRPEGPVTPDDGTYDGSGLK